MSRAVRERRRAAAAAAATGVLVGSAIVATRSVAHDVGPASLALFRYAIALCILALAARVSGGRVRFAARDLLPIALLGVVQFGVLIVLLNESLRFIASARAALLFATMPLMTMALAAALGRERFTAATILGVLLTVAGVALALGERALRPAGSPDAWTGDAAAIGSALSGAVCSVLYRPYLRRYPALEVSAIATLAAVVFLAVPAAVEGAFRAAPHLTPDGWLAVLFIGVNSGVGYFLWLWALGHAEATRVTVFLSLSPITAAVLGAVLLGEGLSGPTLLGTACVVAGLWVAHRRPEDAAGNREGAVV